MNAAAAASSLAGGSFETRPLAGADPQQTEDLSALWKQVLAKAHATAPEQDAPNDATDSGDGRRFADPPWSESSRYLRPDGVAAVAEPAAAAVLAASVAPAPAAASTSMTWATDSAPLSTPVLSEPALPLEEPKVDAAWQSPFEGEPRATSALLPALDTADAAPCSDVVHVFLRRGDVDIVVRDAGLSDAHAIRCAFETARALTGEAATLRHLVLNGRSVYRQPMARVEDSRAAATRTVVSFGC